MKFFGRILNPLVALIGIQLAWVLVVVFWIYWFLGSNRKLRALAERYSPELLQGGLDWIILVEGLLLLAVILAGVYVLFLYWNRQVHLYRAQRDFIAQMTHELKSPLASLQLHLETIRLRRPEPPQLESFVKTMLEDTDRLHGLINNLLSANRLDQKGLRLTLRPCDFSAFITSYFEERRATLPPGAKLELEIEEGLFTRIEAESFEMVLRNLLENSVLYADGPPRIRISLVGEGGYCHLTFADQGRGIERREQKKVFRIFYRVRRSGETIRGSGLGLFIVRAMVIRHKGKVWLESDGANKGTRFHIQLPRIDRNDRRELT